MGNGSSRSDIGLASRPASGGVAHHVIAPEAVPEGLHAIEHLLRPLEELFLVEARRVERLPELVGGVGRVLVLDLVVPGPEPERQQRGLPLLECLEAGDDLLPEPGSRPVLDRQGGSPPRLPHPSRTTSCRCCRSRRGGGGRPPRRACGTTRGPGSRLIPPYRLRCGEWYGHWSTYLRIRQYAHRMLYHLSIVLTKDM